MAKSAKSHSGAKKRLKVTKTGKVMTKKAGNNHLLGNKGKNHKSYPNGKSIFKTFGDKLRLLVPSRNIKNPAKTTKSTAKNSPEKIETKTPKSTPKKSETPKTATKIATKTATKTPTKTSTKKTPTKKPAAKKTTTTKKSSDEK